MSTEYERNRQAQIERNRAMLAELGLLAAREAMKESNQLSTPPKEKILRPQPHALQTKKHLTRGRARQEPRRITRARAQEETISTPLASHRDESPPAIRPAKRPKRQSAQFSAGCVRAQRMQLANMDNDQHNLVEDLKDFLFDARKHVPFCAAMSVSNSRAVLNKLSLLACGAGIHHPYNEDAPVFMGGERLRLDADVGALEARASQWLNRYGQDRGNGWLVIHPLRKFARYQEYLLSDMAN